MNSKRGAIELSMTTIIVVVIGVVLLGLGIGWITSLIAQVEELTEQSFAAAQQTIQEQMPSGAKFYISGYTVKGQAGKFTEIYTGVKFSGEENTQKWFILEVLDKNGNPSDWFTLASPLLLNVGIPKGIPIGVKIPEYQESSTQHSFTIIAYWSDSSTGPWEAYDSSAIILEVE